MKLNFSKNSKGKNTIKFFDAKSRMVSVVESDPIGKEQSIWCGYDTGDRMRLTQTQAHALAEQLEKFSVTGTLE
ncbi:hypothetical protein [Leptospira stimsonii]|uniref:Uncharacterized protein n=1 Tax=Leptospira stimsonii TaxID=2202203 RepID=A0ABY2N9B0_9LEPT|nr:hypothetical protein [Leptospira stimsonii]TGK10371.1 hypothetical protein EHO98_22945 [Leptospira stimsonii]TGM18745.1 hypothetical protein EHQ90_06655 [Leptospira stimsonii]